MPTENTPKTLADLQRHPVLRHFLKISSIPRRSFYEKEIGEYLLDWARELGLSARMDDLYNVYVRKPASPGQEGKKPVILQAHTDMVCEKAPGVAHDFATDPLHLELNGDILSTGGRTTLGADDGMGCALAMAIVENDDIVHPPLEVLFTTAEEDDMRGAAGVDASFLTGEYLINLDNMQEDRPVAGSAGGTGVHITVPTEVVPIPAQTMPCRLAVAGLPGGHSGGDIAKGHGNAILL